VTHFARVHPQIVWAKLGTSVAGARLANKELWRRAPRRLARKRAGAQSAPAKRRAVT
jgi:hypothetical protein